MSDFDEKLKALKSHADILKAQQDRFEKNADNYEAHLNDLKSQISEHVQVGITTFNIHTQRVLNELPELIDNKIELKFREHIAINCTRHDNDIEELRNNDKIVFREINEIKKGLNFYQRASIYIVKYWLPGLATVLTGVATWVIFTLTHTK
jgi:hypothetical protein